MCEEVKIRVTDNVEKIMCKNLDEKVESKTIKVESCEDCKYYDKPWVWGGVLHCCCHSFEGTKSSREIDELYNDCPINHTIELRTSLIKKYGIIHEEPSESYSNQGYISVVDFSRTRYEWDGNNPDVDWYDVVTFHYRNPEEAEKMMDLAVEYYNKFNLDDVWVKKECYG